MEFSEFDEGIYSIICDDLENISNEFEYKTDIYEKLPLSRIFKDDEYTRCYALDYDGGVVIFADELGTAFNIITINERDGYYRPHCKDVYGTINMNKITFVALISEALSLLNNNI